MLFYIHIPFCDSKCHYCSFNSYVDKFFLKDKFLEALKKQIIFEIERFEITSNSIETLYIGGGTPSTIEASKYEDIFRLLKPYFKKDIQISIEANPNSATLDWLQGVKKFGVDRVSFGVQSFDDKKLKFLGRSHNSNQAKEAIKNAKIAGFENISIDLIYGSSRDSVESIKKELMEIDRQEINHISLYSLTLEEHTKFFGKNEVVDDSIKNAEYLTEEIQKRGFEWYEISNFGKGYQSEHNLGYWKYRDYVGAGCGAVGFRRDRRFYTQNSIEEYVKNPLSINEEVLSEENIKLEKIFLGFRSNIGVDRELLNAKELGKVEILCEENRVEFKNNRYFNSNFFLSDELALFLTS